MPLKGNQPKLEEAASILMQTTKENNPSLVSHYEDDDNGVYLHGRICNRCYELITDPSLVGEMLKGTSFENCAHAVGMVERCREVVKYDENKERIPQPPESQTVYYLLDTNDISVEKFAMYVRDHWYGSEIIHYVLDTEFDEDLSRVCKGNGMQNFSILRKAAVSILSAIKKNTKRISFHAIRETIRNLGGIEQKDVIKPYNTVNSPYPSATG